MPIYKRELDHIILENCVVFSNKETTYKGFVKCLLKYIHLIGPWSIILTGSHGYDNGEDGLCNISCLNSSKRKHYRLVRLIQLDLPCIEGVVKKQSQTREFYSEWCEKYFDGEPEGEDPRIYEDTKVAEIKDRKLIPSWKDWRKENCETTFKVSNSNNAENLTYDGFLGNRYCMVS